MNAARNTAPKLFWGATPSLNEFDRKKRECVRPLHLALLPPKLAEMQPLYRIGETEGVHVAELFLSDSLDEMEFDSLNEALLKAVDGAAAEGWVLDLSHTSYMGSSVLGLLVNLRQRIKQARGSLILCGVSPQVDKIFRACCMERLFVMARARAEAMERVKN